MALELFLAIAPTIVDYTIGPVIRHVGYPFRYKTNVEERDKEVERLKVTREKVQHSVDEDTRNGRSIEREVEEWLLKVDEITEKVARERMEDEGRAKMRCFKVGFCPNLKTRYQLSKKAEKEALDASELQTRSEFGTISYRTVPRWMFVSGYKTLQSRESVFKEIMDALTIADVNTIGVHGMGGVGKTTLVKQVAKQAVEEKSFDAVVMATVTQTPDIMKIQGQIADMLGLKFDEESEWGRAGRLRERIKQVKKILVVLDDLWEMLDLEVIGIPAKDEHKGCKILVTSRDLDVLSAGMGSQNNFALGVLPEEEAWDLFRNMAGDKVENHLVRPVAVDVAKECAGLPVAIVTVARALKNKGLSEWKVAFRELKRPSPENFVGLQKAYYSCIELSYNHLESEQLRSTFLVYSLMGDDLSIRQMLKYGVGLGLFPSAVTVEDAQETVNSLLHKLRASCLLLDDDTGEQYAVHDIVCDVAKSIASRDRHVFVASNEAELKQLDKDRQRRCTQIWLRCNVTELPEDLECPQLDLLQIISDNPGLKLPDNIFEGMQKLRVLDLTNFSFSVLPSSLHLLKNLTTLCLDQSELFELGDIAVIGELKKLEVLSFFHSELRQLPREISQLTKLKLLDLSDCSLLEVIPPNVISNLSKLEELCMGNSFHQWDPEGKNNASLAEFKNLSHLTNLEICILDSQLMSTDMFAERLQRFRMFIGDVWDWDGVHKNKTLRAMKLKLNVSVNHLEDGIQMLLKRTEDLYFLELNGVENIVSELDREGFQQLKHLHLRNSPKIQYIVNTMDGIPNNVFPVLESLILENLVSLVKISNGALKAGSFSKLRIIEAKNCDTLKNLLTMSVARGLSQLQKIKVRLCAEMEEIVAEESVEFDKNEPIGAIEFTQLHSLSLEILPCLRNFCSSVKTSCVSQTQSTPSVTGAGSDEIISADEMRTPLQLFNEKIVFPNLEELNLELINIERLWHDEHPAVSVSIQNLQRLFVYKCNKLKYLFSSSMIKSLVHLKHLSVSWCDSMEEIILIEGLKKEERTSKISFLEVEHIVLDWLPKLKRFCSGSVIECPLLKRLNMKSCRELESFISSFSSTNTTVSNEPREGNLEENNHYVLQPLFDDKVWFPSLTEIEISQMDNMERIWHNQLADGSFCKLRKMDIYGCDKLVNIFSPILLKRFHRLEVLRISNSRLLEGIFELQDFSIEGTLESDAFQLRDLSLYFLPKLKHIWNHLGPRGKVAFPKLQRVSVDNCKVLKNVFPLYVARDLLQLEELQISSCDLLEEIVAKEEDNEAAPCFQFPQLTSLKLDGVPKFRNFYSGEHAWECPMLRSLTVYKYGDVKLFDSSLCVPTRQPLFFVEKVTFKLEKLSLRGDDTATSIIWHGKIPAGLYSMLKVLNLYGFRGRSVGIPFGFLRRLCNLETLTVEHGSLKTLFLFEGLDEADQTAFLAQLRNLTLSYVANFGHIWEQEHRLGPVLQSLGTLDISFTDLVNLAPSSASFEKLTTLKICGCHQSVNVIASSTAKSLVQLVKLTINYCNMVTEIVAKQGDESKDEIIFSKLEYLALDNLKNLTCFCPGNYIFRFPSLKEMVVVGCPNMSNFSPGVLSTPKLRGVCWQKSPKKVCWQGNLNSTIQYLYTEMVSLDGLWVLKLSDFSLLKERWHGQLPFNFFTSLRTLKVDGCPFISSAISSNLLRFMKSLGELRVENCDSLEGVFDLAGIDAVEEHNRPLLRVLHLNDLPNLTHIWNKDPRGILDFKNLIALQVNKCSKLRNIFTPSTALSLVRLERIEIRNCTMMEEIITKERAGEAAVDKIIFHELKAVVLKSLPNLVSFYSGCGILEIPFLEEISIDSCPLMKPFISSFIRELEPDSMDKGKEPRSGKGDHDISTASLLKHKVASSNLKKLRVNWNDVMEVIRHGQFRVELFCKLNVLELVCFPKDSVDFPSRFIQKFTNLEKLLVSEASFEEIVLHEETNTGEKHRRVLAKLKNLELSKLPKLVHLSMVDSQPCPLLQNLEYLGVLECGKLKILAPSSISFQCLVDLLVSSCHGLVNLFTSLAAKHLVQLKHMTITECKMIEEIIASKENEAANEVIFHKLESLTLDGLPSLKSFYLGDCTFTFPFLEDVRIIGCHKMNFFSRGVIDTPKLWCVRFTKGRTDDDEGCWEGNLDATIRMMFIEMGDGTAQSSLPSLPNQPTLASDCETSRADRNGPGASSERQASEDFNVTGTSDTAENLLPAVETTVVTKVNRVKGILEEPEITQLASRNRDFHAASNYEEEDPKQHKNSSNPMDSETPISPHVQSDGVIFTLKLLYLLSFLYPYELILYMFPCLETVTVNKCPKMKTFSMGVISTPKLEGVRLKGPHYVEYLEDDLNSTVQKLFMEMGDGAAQSNLPSSSKLTCETSQDDKNGPNAVSGAQTSLDSHVAVIANIHEDLPLAVGTISGTIENSIRCAFREDEITQLTPRYQDFHATSSDKNEPLHVQIIPASSTQHIPVCTATAVEQPAISTATSLTQTTSQEFACGAALGTTSKNPPVSVKEIEPPSSIIERLVNPSPASSSQAALRTDSNAESCDLSGVNSKNYGYSMALFKRILVETLKEVSRSDDGLSLPSSLKNPPNPNAIKDLSTEAETTRKLELKKEAVKNASIDYQSSWPGSTNDVTCATSDYKDSTQGPNLLAPIGIETHIYSQVQIDPLLNDKDELKQDQVRHASSVGQSSRVPTSPTITFEQDPRLDSASRTKAYCSQELLSGTVSRQMQEVPTAPIIERSSRTDTNCESRIAIIEKLLNPSPSAPSQPASSSSTEAESQELNGTSFETYSSSMPQIKRILMKSPAQVASSADRLLLLSSMMNLKNCPLLNAQQLEIVQVYIENFDSLMSNHPSYEQQIDSTGALKLSIEDNKKRISELMNRYEDLTSKIGTLSATKEALKRKLCEVEEDEAQTREDMEDIHAQLISRKGKLETHMKVLPEAERQQRVAVDKACNVNDYWAKMRSLFAYPQGFPCEKKEACIFCCHK